MTYPKIVSKETLEKITKALNSYIKNNSDIDDYMEYHIYAITDPRSEELVIWYIGQTKDIKNRMKEHFTPISWRTNRHLSHKISKYLVPYAISPEYFILCSCKSKREVIIAEISWICYYKDINMGLCNITDGGDGFITYKMTESHRKSLSLASLGKKKSTDHRKNISLGRIDLKFTDKHKKALMKASVGNTNASGPRSQAFKDSMKGNTNSLGKTHTVSKETREKLRRANLGKTQSPETIEKKRQALLGYKHSDQSRLNMSGPKSDAMKAKLSAANMGKKHSDETKKKLSLINKGKKQSSETIRKRQLTCHIKHSAARDFDPATMVNTRRQCPLCVELLGLDESSIMKYVDSKRIQSQDTIDKKRTSYKMTKKIRKSLSA